MSERYPLEQAQEEAAKIKKLVESGSVRSYAEAEKVLEKNKMIPVREVGKADTTRIDDQVELEEIRGKLGLGVDQLKQRAMEAIKVAGYEVDETAPPYKSFNQRERFFIQKCRDAAGKDVVIKIAAPEEQARRSVEKEIWITSLLDSAVRKALIEGKKVEIKFPEIMGEINTHDTRGMISRFIYDDKEAKRELTTTERYSILTEVVSDLQKLDVPYEVYQQKGLHWEQEIPVKTGVAHIDIVKYDLKRADKMRALTTEESTEILALFEQNKELLDSFPMKFAHGDIHGQNIAYEQMQDGARRVTLMDLETLSVDNEFFDWAMLTTRAAVGREAGRHADVLKDYTKQMKESWFDEASAPLEAVIENDVIKKHPRGREAQIVYHLMRIESCLNSVAANEGKTDPVSQASQEVYSKILREQLVRIRGES